MNTKAIVTAGVIALATTAKAHDLGPELEAYAKQEIEKLWVPCYMLKWAESDRKGLTEWFMEQHNEGEHIPKEIMEMNKDNWEFGHGKDWKSLLRFHVNDGDCDPEEEGE